MTADRIDAGAQNMQIIGTNRGVGGRRAEKAEGTKCLKICANRF